MDSIPQYPLYGSTFHLYRLSPLYHGDSSIFEDSALRMHSRRLRDVLKGDNLRGVQVDFLGSENLSRNSGPLEECDWNLLGDESSWTELQTQSIDSESQDIISTTTPETARGIQIDLHYSKHTHSAFILRDPDKASSPSGFTSLPLLLVRMPAAIREIFLNYLSTAFDTRISPLKLRPSFLTSALESHLARLTASISTQSIPDILKVVQLQLSFPTSTKFLKSIDISIAREDIPGFLKRGKFLSQQAQTGPVPDPSAPTGPFITALSHYTTTHLALSLFHPKTHISKLACGAFALASEGRIKLYPPPPLSSSASSDTTARTTLSAAEHAMRDLYASLIQEASSRGRFIVAGVEPSAADIVTPVGTKGKARSGPSGKRALADITGAAPKRQKGGAQAAGQEDPVPPEDAAAGAPRGGRDSIPAEPPPPYELHDPAIVSAR
ncbi:hypothetical protein AOQ84DRAFT_352833 [Glonium stellatum]|uniref:Uncharacterized protein n=1 Tax=Glonium stellatum TaxID=574774 RepID=A0A8E2JWK6_9PEZI|nr:hypothetical protein AOQ84DRAFT_352833 [Glonium stellatum]